MWCLSYVFFLSVDLEVQISLGALSSAIDRSELDLHLRTSALLFLWLCSIQSDLHLIPLLPSTLHSQFPHRQAFSLTSWSGHATPQFHLIIPVAQGWQKVLDALPHYSRFDLSFWRTETLSPAHHSMQPQEHVWQPVGPPWMPGEWWLYKKYDLVFQVALWVTLLSSKPSLQHTHQVEQVAPWQIWVKTQQSCKPHRSVVGSRKTIRS